MHLRNQIGFHQEYLGVQLVSFQIKECFGFRDSGPVDLQEPTNLIYILGRNSFGKTSFLTALSNFSPSLTPRDYPNFANFDPTSEEPKLLCKYKVERSGLTVEAFVKAFLNKMEKMNPNITTALEFQNFTGELTEQLIPIYTRLIEWTMDKGYLWVKRNASGDYQFSTRLNFEDSTGRIKQQVQELLSKLPSEMGMARQSNGQYVITGHLLQLPTSDDIENLLSHQLPVIVWFNKAYALLDVLPNVIKVEHLNQSPNQLTTALVDYLGKQEVERLLKGQNPREGRELLTKLQERIDILMREVNRERASGTELLTIDLYRSDGLQITVMTGNKPSFYRHLSDNTKLLFAYHLYTSVYDLRGNILLFDEPNNGFHATAQERLFAFLRNLGSKGNVVIFSTHSEHMIDPDHLTGVRLMTADDQGYLSVRNKWYGSTAGHGDFDALRPILDAIGLKYGANHLTIRDKVIITEGVTELLYLRAFRQLLGYESELHIAPATGDKTIPHIVALLISQGLHFKVVVDTTIGHKSTKNELQAGYDIPDASIYEVAVPTKFPDARGSGIEDIFSKTDFAKLLSNTGNTPGDDFETLSNSQYMKKQREVPKRVIAHEFNTHITTYSKADFDEETLTNIRSILDFCLNDAWFLL